MEREKIRDKVVKMVDGLIEEVLDERKSEFDMMKATVKKRKKSFQGQRKLIVDATSYSISGEVTHAVDVTPKSGTLKERLIKRKKDKRR